MDKGTIEKLEFQGKEFELDIQTKDIWLSEQEIAEFYKVTRQAINTHINGIFEDEELSSDNCCKFFLHQFPNGQTRKIKTYNLDMVCHIGYRVRSDRGILLRTRATEALKGQHNQIQNKSQTALIAEALLDIDSRVNKAEEGIQQLEHKLDNTPIEIDGAKAGRLHNLLSEYGKRLGNYSHGYGRFKRHYRLGSYKQLPLRLYEEAVALVENWLLELGENSNQQFLFEGS